MHTSALNRIQLTAKRTALTMVSSLLAAFAMSQSNAKPLNLELPSQALRVTDQMGITQKLGNRLPLDLPFLDENGKKVQLGDYFGKRPVVLLPIFYNCQTACSTLVMGVLKTLAKASKNDTIRVGREFDVVAFSIHPKETVDLAKSKKAWIMETFEQPKTEAGWHLLIGEQDSVKKLADAIGFKYGYDPVKDLINHPVCTVMVTDKGIISSYTIGIGFASKELEENLSNAERGIVGKKADQSAMFGCIMIDPVTGKRSIVIEQVVKYAGFLTILILGFSIVMMNRRSRPFDPTSGGSTSPKTR